VKNLIPADPVYTKVGRTDHRNTQAVPFYQANAECYYTEMYLHVIWGSHSSKNEDYSLLRQGTM